MAKIAYSTQITVETHLLLEKYIKATGAVKAVVTDEAIKEYISARMKEEK